MGDEDIMYEPLLDDIDVETLINEDDITRRTVRRRAGGSRPKRRGEVGGPGRTKDLRGRAGRQMLAPQAHRCYKKRSCHL